MKVIQFYMRLFVVCCLSISLLIISNASQAQYVRKFKMFDVPQNADPAWGDSWCAPTAVGNSLAWLAKEYDLGGLMKVNGAGAAMSAQEVINDLGKNYMNTDPDAGTSRSVVADAKLKYIKDHGLKDKIKVESQVAIPKLKQNGAFDGYNGAKVTKAWLEEQYNKGQDVEFAVSYYEKQGNEWIRKGGHVEVKDGAIPGEDAGGHMLSMAGYYDPFESSSDSDFQISFTDPGRNDLAGEYGALFADQYSLTDFWGNSYLNTASTYQVIYDPNALGLGMGALLLDGYQGAGDFASDGANRRFITVLEAGWAESPVPEPNIFVLAMIAGASMIIVFRRKRNIKI